MGLVKERRGKSREAGTIGASPSGGFLTSTTSVAYIYNITASQVKANEMANFFIESGENVLLNWITFFHLFSKVLKSGLFFQARRAVANIVPIKSHSYVKYIAVSIVMSSIYWHGFCKGIRIP